MFHDTVLHFFKTMMIFIECLLNILEIEIIFCKTIPRKVKQQFKIIELQTIFSNLWIDPPYFCNLTIESILNSLAPLFLFSAFNKQAYFSFLGICSQFILNSFQLLIEKIITLLFFNINSYFGFKLRLKFKH